MSPFDPVTLHDLRPASNQAPWRGESRLRKRFWCRGQASVLSRRAQAVGAAIVLVLIGLVWRSQVRDEPQWWDTIERDLEYFPSSDHDRRLPDSVSNGRVSVAMAVSNRDRFDRGVVVTDLVDQSATYVSLFQTTPTSCLRSANAAAACWERPDDQELSVGPAGFVIDYRWEVGDDLVHREAAFSYDGTRWLALPIAADHSEIVVGTEGVYAVGSTKIERLDVPANEDVPWEVDHFVKSAAFSNTLKVVVVEEPTGVVLWTQRSSSWTSQPLAEITTGLDLDRDSNTGLRLISVEETIQLLNLRVAELDEVSNTADRHPIAWMTTDGATWNTIDIPIADALAKPHRSLRHLSSDGAVIVNEGDRYSTCLGSSLPCAQIPPFAVHIGVHGVRTTTHSYLPRGKNRQASSSLGVTADLDTLAFVVYNADDVKSEFLRAPREDWSSDDWFDIEWQPPLRALEDLSSTPIPSGGLWTDAGFHPNDPYLVFFRRVDQTPLDEPGTVEATNRNVLVKRLVSDRVELLSYPDGPSLGEFTIELE